MGPFQMSSRKPVSTARPQTFWSMEYGFFGTSDRQVPFSSAKMIALSRLIPESRTGASTFRSGAERADRHLEADLIVALAGAAVRDGGGAEVAARPAPGA